MRPAAWLLVVSVACSAGCSAVLGLDGYGSAPTAADAGRDTGSDASSGSSSGSSSSGADSGSADRAVADQANDVVFYDVSPDAPPGSPPSAAVSASAIDFGISACGAAAPANRGVTLTNVGGLPLVWQAALNTTAYFAISGTAAGSLDPGASTTVTVAAQPVPAFGIAGNSMQAMLTITTNDPTNPTVSVPIKLVAGGASLTVVPTSAAFGQVSVGTSATPIPITLTNTGNLPVTLGFTQPATTALSLSWMGAPATVVVMPGMTVPNLVANFLPTAIASVADTAGITTNGAMCGTSPSTIGMTGTGSSSLVTVQPGILDFGSVNCGSQAAAQSVTIHNTGTASISYTAALSTGTAFMVSPAAGSVGAGASVTVNVTPNPVPATSAVTPNGYGDTLTITTTAVGDMPHTIPLNETAQGAILTQSTASIPFGPVAIGTTATSQFTVTNTGNASATVSFATQSNAFSVTPQGQTVGGGSSYTPLVSFVPAAATTYMDTATMSVAQGTVLCSPLPAGATLSGSGTGTTEVDVSPTNLDFGLVDCGARAMAQTVTITNNGTGSFIWNGKLGTSNYDFNPKNGTLAAGASVTVTVTPAPIPNTSAVTADLYADTLTFTTDAPGDMPHAVALHETAQGAILSFNPTMLSVGSVKIGNSTQSPFEVVNKGNLTATATLSVMGGQSGFFKLAPPSVPVAGAGGASMVQVTFSPTVQGPASTMVSVSTSAPLCSPLPSPLQVSGTGAHGGG
jgi:hypothetical protein